MSALRSIKNRLKPKIKAFVVKKSSARSFLWFIIFLVGSWEYLKLRLLALRTPANAAVPRRREAGFKVAFVLPWYGHSIVGGAETATYDLVQAIKRYQGTIEVEVLTTTLKDFVSDWNTPHYKEGVEIEQGVCVRRFHPTQPNRSLFHFLNGQYLMPGGTKMLWDVKKSETKSPIPAWAEAYYLRNMIVSPSMLQYLKRHSSGYDFTIFVPYMFAPTAMGSLLLGRRALVMPCLHDERYAYMRIFKKCFARVGGFLCLVKSEQELAHRLYPDLKKSSLIGAVVDTEVAQGEGERFRKKFGIDAPFILYTGRQIEGKNLPLLVSRFEGFKRSHPSSPLLLVLLGKGDLDYRDKPDVLNLGFVSSADKSAAYAAALGLCQPSLNESFSIVIMEAWLQKTPVLVHRGCEVTREHVVESKGGFIFDDQATFDHAVLQLLESEDLRRRLGENGRKYVMDRYAPESVVKSFEKALHAF